MSIPSSWPAHLLSGPVIWIMHFWVVYLWAEAGCVTPQRIMGFSSVAIVTILATVVAVGAIILFGLRTNRAFQQADTRGDHRRLLYYLGLLLSGMSVVATLFVGLPALFLEPC